MTEFVRTERARRDREVVVTVAVPLHLLRGDAALQIIREAAKQLEATLHAELAATKIRNRRRSLGIR
jgi:hypothetical protein